MTDPYTILAAFVSAYKGDEIADSDLDDEQPKHITVTLGDIRAAQRALREHEQRVDMDAWREGYAAGCADTAQRIRERT